MRRTHIVWLVTMAWLLFMPAAARAQSAGSGVIAGVVKDATGAVLPGVTVEAASPALIEKVRTAVTDDQGNYKIVDLRPGAYTVTFTLPGFGTYKRDGIELTTGFTAQANAEMKVGAVEETVTVTGASPIVDVQNVLTQTVLRRDVLDQTPTAKTLTGFASLTLGMKVGGTSAVSPDVGGTVGEGTVALSIHGGRDNDMHVKVDGVAGNNFNCNGGGQCRHFYLNHAGVEEVTLQTGGISAENEAGGVEINAVPKEGGNTIKGNFNFDWTNHAMQSGNLTAALRARGLATQPGIDYMFDVNGGFGGAIRKDRLWFFTAHRLQKSWQFIANNYYNLTPNTLFYAPDLNRPGLRGREAQDDSVRLTWQVAPRHKVNVNFIYDDGCSCFDEVSGPVRPDGSKKSRYKPVNQLQLAWTSPLTNKFLLDARAAYLKDVQTNIPNEGTAPGAISVTDLADGYRYGAHFNGLGLTDYGKSWTTNVTTKFSASYITGSHAFKAGMTTLSGSHQVDVSSLSDVAYTFNNRVPTQVVEIARPLRWEERVKLNLGIYAQDQWTIRRLTINAGLRFDSMNAYTPEQTRPASFFSPALQVSPVHNTPNWKDLAPRVGGAYDLFGNGKTALKVSLGKYNLGETTTIALASNPGAQVVSTTTRTWSDANRNYVPDCDLRNPIGNGECGQIANLAFGTVAPNLSYDPTLLTGWGVRPFNWQTSAAVQHEIVPGVGLNVGYFRTWYKNFRVTDNVRIGPGDFDPFCITTPSDSRLPAGGSRQLCGLYDIKPTAFGLVQNVITDAETYGGASETFDGVDLAVSARFGRGGFVSGGLSTGKTVVDNCNVVDSPQALFCKTTLSWSGQTQYKMNAVYPLPYDIKAAIVFQNLPGIPVQANYVAGNAAIAPSLGRNLGQCRGAATCNGTLAFNLIEPNTVFENRVNQVDLRFSKLVRLGAVRIQGNVDLYNALNGNTITQVNTRYGATWLQATAIQSGRLLKFGGQINF